MAKKSYKILKTIIAIILLTIVMLGLVSIKNNSNAVNYNKTSTYSGTQLLGNSMLYDNYAYNYVPYRGLALQGSQVYAAATYKYAKGQIVYFGSADEFLSNPYLYCMNRGYDYAEKNNYYCYEVGIIEPTIAYIVDQQEKNEKRDSVEDEIANAIWKWAAGNGEKYSASIPLDGTNVLENLFGKADVAIKLKEKGNVTITGPGNEIMPNTDGKYGPFKITYPNYNGEFVGDNIKLIINDEEHIITKENIPASGVEFYLTEDDGIKPGENNIIRIVYEGNIYSGTYAKFTPYRNVLIYKKCPRCSLIHGFIAEGYCKTNGEEVIFSEVDEGKGIVYSGESWDESGNKLLNKYHYNVNGTGICSNCDYRGMLGGVEGKECGPENTYDRFQNLIYVKPEKKPINDDDDIEFLAGKLITLEGKVWLDGQTGLKEVKEPNNVYDVGESPIENIEVILKKDGDDTPVQTTKTDSNGMYKFEKVVSDGKTKYYIEFRYDGINYEAVKANEGADEIDSDATEVGRTEFNNKFETITKTTALTYEYEDGVSGEFDKAILQTTDGDVVKDEFAMLARTEPVAYDDNTTNIDLGLVERGVDLSASIGVEKASVKINDDLWTDYQYIKINEEQEDSEINNNKFEFTERATYNLYLYKSDYNYRIKDYIGLTSATQRSEYSEDEYTELLRRKSEEGELEVKLTYRVVLNNESATDATINNVAIYYDKDLTMLNKYGESITEYTIETIDGKEYKKNVIVNLGLNLTDSDNQFIFPLSFSVNKNAETGAIATGEFKNWVEITSYSAGGCIDTDSEPGNIEDNHFEDDSDSATSISIEIKDTERTISGYVFEDKKEGTANSVGNGFYEDGENKVNDVIVQLIEVKDITIGGTTKRLEYIWQETTSGSNTVKYITTAGDSIGTYTRDVQPGEYKFEGFIPGNYIVRFIYGDGTYYDVSTDEGKANILKYNGQDYKSAIDLHYQDKEHNETSYANNSSMARDNEMRRIEQMAYAVTVTDIKKLEIDNQEELKDTWMCAETSDINVDIEADTDTVISKNINFGLVKRPEVSLELEKHITSLTIDGNTTNIDLDDIKKASENDYKINGVNGEVTSITITNKEVPQESNTNKNTIGTWNVATELDKIQGKDMYITYTYTIKSVGEQSYIGSALAGIDLVNVNDTTWESIKENINSNSYKRGTYLGTVYYDGKTDNLEGTIKDRIEVKIEDYLKSTLSVDNISSTNNWEFEDETAEKNVWLDISNNKTDKEIVNIVRSDNILIGIGEELPNKTLTVKQQIDTSGGKDLEYRSYVAQLIGAGNAFTTKAGLTLNSTLGNLAYVQSYSPYTKTTDIAKENDEFVAETVLITANTGGTVADSNIEQKLNLVIAVVAGLAVVATGIVLIKKFVIK